MAQCVSRGQHPPGTKLATMSSDQAELFNREILIRVRLLSN